MTRLEGSDTDLRAMVAARLRAIRRSRGMSQQDLSDRSGIKLATYLNYEYGYSFPPVPNLRLLCLALRVSANYLICLVDEPKAQEAEVEMFGVERIDYT